MITDVEWHQTTNRDNGSLKTAAIRVEVGDTIEIRGEGRQRRVTYVMGSPGNWHATFKGQGAVPEGPLEWRLVSRAGAAFASTTTASPVVSTIPVSAAPVTAPPHKSESRPHTLKLALEIVAVAITAVGGITALVWRSR